MCTGLPPGLYDWEGAAAYLGVSVNTVAYHVYQAKDLVPSVRKAARYTFFTKEDLDAYLARKRGAGRPRKVTAPEPEAPGT